MFYGRDFDAQRTKLVLDAFLDRESQVPALAPLVDDCLFCDYVLRFSVLLARYLLPVSSLHHGDHAVRGTQVNSNYFWHNSSPHLFLIHVFVWV